MTQFTPNHVRALLEAVAAVGDFLCKCEPAEHRLDPKCPLHSIEAPLADAQEVGKKWFELLKDTDTPLDVSQVQELVHAGYGMARMLHQEVLATDPDVTPALFELVRWRGRLAAQS